MAAGLAAMDDSFNMHYFNKGKNMNKTILLSSLILTCSALGTTCNRGIALPNGDIYCPAENKVVSSQNELGPRKYRNRTCTGRGCGRGNAWGPRDGRGNGPRDGRGGKCDGRGKASGPRDGRGNGPRDGRGGQCDGRNAGYRE